MSMNTIVTIVLVVVTLILALVLIRTIFSGSTNAITSINSEIQNQINQLFASNANTNLVIDPNGGQFNVQRGTPSGFAFSIKNPEQTSPANFNYVVNATQVSACNGSISLEQANGYILGASGPLSIGPAQDSTPVAVLFNIPSSSPACTLVYQLTVTETTGSKDVFFSNLFVTIQ